MYVRCSMISASVSTWPYIIVAVERMPMRCASRCTSSHASGPPFLTEMRLRTRVARISAPPPGSVRWPASYSASSTPRIESPETCTIWWISGAEKKCGVMCGKRWRASRTIAG